MNPARRKAAKAKADAAQNSQADAETAQGKVYEIRANSKTDQTGEKGLSKDAATKTQPRKPSVQGPQTTQAKSLPPPPIPVERQNTETVLKGHKPNLTRTVTAPPANSKANSLALATPAFVTGGLVGCAASAAILLGVGLWYDFSGAESAILAARTAKLCVDNLAEDIIASLKAGTYSADEALDILRRTTLAYASTIPEGAPFVERVFREIDMVRKQRGREIDKVVAETYAELSKAGKKGATPAEMRTIVIAQFMKLSSFASHATQDVVARNPKLRPFKDGAVKSLQGPPETKIPTVRVNMVVRQKSTGPG